MSSFDKDLYSKGASYLVDDRAYDAYVLNEVADLKQLGNYAVEKWTK